MINVFLFWILSFTSLIWVSWIFYSNIKIKKEKLTQQEINLKKQNDDFSLRTVNEAWLHKQQVNELIKKKSEIINLYDSAVEKIEESNTIREQTQNQVISLQKQINKLQSELYNARQKSKRLVANRSSTE